MISDDFGQAQAPRSRGNSSTGPSTAAGKARVTQNLPRRVGSKPEVAPYAPSLLDSMPELRGGSSRQGAEAELAESEQWRIKSKT